MRATSTPALEMRINLSEEEVDRLETGIVEGEIKVHFPDRPTESRPLNLVIAEVTDRIVLNSYPSDVDVYSQRCYKIELSDLAYIDIITHGFAVDRCSANSKVKVVDEKRLRLCGIDYI